jgi:predicted small secreted protein
MLIRLMALAILVGFLGGCNTMEGAGMDVERAGQKLQDESREHR